MSQDIYILIEHLHGQVADISYTMLAAGHVLSKGSGGNVVAVLLGHNVQGLAANLAADNVLYFDHFALADFTSDAYAKVLGGLITEKAPRVVLFGHSSVGTDVAGLLSAKLEIPIVSQCYWVSVDGNHLQFVSQMCGGKIMAEGELPAPTVLVTMAPGGYKPEEGQSSTAPMVIPSVSPALDGLRVTLDHYIEPDTSDVDISKEPVLIAIGRGIQTQDNIELAEELARALGGVVSASRPVVDQGWLPTTRLVGKSGKSVKPKLYLAFGISGAPEHVEAITGSDTIIAINTDPAAPIFSLAKYGAVIDMFDLLPVLTEQIQQAKG